MHEFDIVLVPWKWFLFYKAYWFGIYGACDNPFDAIYLSCFATIAHCWKLERHFIKSIFNVLCIFNNNVTMCPLNIQFWPKLFSHHYDSIRPGCHKTIFLLLFSVLKLHFYLNTSVIGIWTMKLETIVSISFQIRYFNGSTLILCMGTWSSKDGKLNSLFEWQIFWE